MIELQKALAILCGVTAIAVVIQVIRNRPPNALVLALLAVIEAGLVAQLVIGIRLLSDAPPGVSVLTFVGYLVVALLVLPLAVGWSWAERSRGGTATILVGLVVVPYLFVRLYQIWVLKQ
ncbi:MAG: hypothetical protein L0H79_16770 [Intrasporangium sp.]|uniref:hypothetical protein n=1 Tax=Intrasporangium sp. TaxID=1925024 RepID=UPI0026484C06|nr:hypothetical protein [Intrasporangium sp.]MDN5797389.1 hypothetical protein [Intrasporangium sp.]